MLASGLAGRLLDHLTGPAARVGGLMRRSVRPHGERGNVAIVVVVSLTMLLGFATLVVDVGLNWAARTSAQAAADGAALAAAQELTLGTPSSVAAQVDTYLADNLPGYAGRGVGWMWDSSVDNGEVECYQAPATPAPNGACANDATAVAVITPPVRQTYALAGLFGATATNVKAAATAQVFSPVGNVVPWSISDAAFAAETGPASPTPGLVCLAAEPGATTMPPPCGDPAVQAGTLPFDAAALGQPCAGVNAVPPAQLDYEDYVEHGLGGLQNGRYRCPFATLLGATLSLAPAPLDPAGPYRPEQLSRGLIQTFPNLDGRLYLCNLPPGPGSAPDAICPAVPGATNAVLGNRIVLGSPVDGPFLDGALLNPADYGPAGIAAPQGSFFEPGKSFADYSACFAADNPNDPACQHIFTADIVRSPRLVYVPIVNGGGVVQALQAVFLEMTPNNTGAPVFTWDEFNPTGWVYGVTGYAIPSWMLPDTVPASKAPGRQPYDPSLGGPRTFVLVR